MSLGIFLAWPALTPISQLIWECLEVLSPAIIIALAMCSKEAFMKAFTDTLTKHSLGQQQQESEQLQQQQQQ